MTDRIILKTLLPMAVDGVGPSVTCVNLLQGMAACNVAGPTYINRSRVRVDLPSVYQSVPPGLSFLPYRWVRAVGSKLAEREFVKNLDENDVTYLWPSVSLRTHELVRRRGNAIFLEGINTRMAYSKIILDDAYSRLGLEPAHGITEARIKEEDEKLAIADAIFAPSPAVEKSLLGSPMNPQGIIATSYGGNAKPRAGKTISGNGSLTVLFVGYGCVRKGLPALLTAWEKAKISGRLIIAGAIEPVLRQRYQSILNRPDVSTPGFVKNVDALYSQADVFVLPSLEEGDPLVTYEAAAHGIPLVVSPMGAGRMGAEENCTISVDPHEADSIAAALDQLARSVELQKDLGQRALKAVANYRWADVGARRANLLRDTVSQLSRKGGYA